MDTTFEDGFQIITKSVAIMDSPVNRNPQVKIFNISQVTPLNEAVSVSKSMTYRDPGATTFEDETARSV